MVWRCDREKDFSHLQSIFANDFIHVPADDAQQTGFDQCLLNLESIGAVRCNGQGAVQVLDTGTLLFVLSLIAAYVNGYDIMLQSLAEHSACWFLNSFVMYDCLGRVSIKLKFVTCIFSEANCFTVQPSSRSLRWCITTSKRWSVV